MQKIISLFKRRPVLSTLACIFIAAVIFLSYSFIVGYRNMKKYYFDSAEVSTAVEKLDRDSIEVIHAQTGKGEIIVLSRKDYVVNLSATWCKPCIEELPVLNMLYEAAQQKKSGMFILMEEALPVVQKFIAKNKITIPVYVTDGPIPNQLQSSIVPKTILVQNKKVRYTATGALQISNMVQISRYL